MKRQAIVLLTMIWLVLGMVSVLAVGATAALPTATLKAIAVPNPSSGRELLLRIEGECPFKTVQTAEGTLFIELKGAKAVGIPKAGQWSRGLLSGYRLVQYTDASGQPVVRVQVETKHQEPFSVQREHAGLRLVFGSGGSTSATSAALPSTSSPVREAVNSATPIRVSPVVVSKGPVRVSAISIKAGAPGETFVDVATSSSPSFRVLDLQNPRRLVVDLEGAHNGTRQRLYAANSPVLKDVRVGQFREKNPAVVRVVADLSGDPVFDVHTSPGGVRIEVKPRNLPKPSEVSIAPAAVPGLATLPKAEKPVRVAVAMPAPEPQTEVIARPASAPVTPQPKPNEVPKPDYQSALPPAANSAQVAAAPRPAVPTSTPEALRAAKAMQVLSSQSASNLEQAQTPAPAGGAASEQPKYTGEPISLNLKDVDLKDFFRLIHEISGLNIIVDPNVTGSVTLVLDSVPWDQALDIVLKNNRLGKTLEGNVLRIARVDTLTAEQESATKLAAAREEAAPLVTLFRPVNYAKAGTINTMLRSWAGGGALTKRGTILVDDRTNTLIVSDIQSQIPIIQSIISKLDRKAKQVAIEARIVLATATFSRSLQAALSGATVNKSGSTLVGGSTGTGASVAPSITFTPGQVSQSLGVGETGAGGFGAFAISNASGRYLINAAISAAETRSEAKTISRPTIVTQNNVSGTVTQGTQIPIQTTINNTISVTYQSASLTLTVTPQVTEDGNVFMIINVTNASPGAVLTTAGPSINTQSANTQVLVPDGGTVVFGGVTVQSRSRSATYVPWLGSIPILGHLFKSSNVQDSDQELLFFVSPKVLTS